MLPISLTYDISGCSLFLVVMVASSSKLLTVGMRTLADCDLFVVKSMAAQMKVDRMMNVYCCCRKYETMNATTRFYKLDPRKANN